MTKKWVIYHKEDKYSFEVYGIGLDDLSTRVILRVNSRVQCDFKLDIFISRTDIPNKVLGDFKRKVVKELI